MTAIQVFLAALLLGYFLGVLVRLFYVERLPGRSRPRIALHASRLPTVIINNKDDLEMAESQPPPLPARARSEFPAMRADLPPMRDRLSTLPKIDIALIERRKKETLS